MAQQVLLPKLGLTMQEGTISEWVARPGAVIRSGDVLMRLETDKVDVDVEAEADGVFHPVAAQGAVLAPGTLVAWLLAEGEEPPGGTAATATAPAEGPADGTQSPSAANGAAPAAPGGRLRVSPNARRLAREAGLDVATLRGTGPLGRVVSEDVEQARDVVEQARDVVEQARDEAEQARDVVERPASAPGARPAAATTTSTGAPAAQALPSTPPGLGTGSPLVRREAGQQGVDVAQVAGSGLGGRVRRADVMRAVALLRDGTTPAAPAPPGATQPFDPAAAAAEDGPRAGDVIPLSGMRGAIARSMHASLTEMAQLTHGFEAEVGALLALRDDLKREYAGLRLRVPTINDFVVRAAALALVQHPLLNATVRDGAVHLLTDVHVGMAVAVPHGLLVPVVRDAASRPLADIATETAALAQAARAGRLTLPQLEGATFAVTSLGSYGVDFFTPVVNTGNVAILGVGRVRDGVRWEGDVPHRTQVLTLSLSFDHRAVDGAPAAQYLQTVARLLARPLLLLAG